MYSILCYETYSNILLSELFLLFISNFLFKNFVFNICKLVPRRWVLVSIRLFFCSVKSSRSANLCCPLLLLY